MTPKKSKTPKAESEPIIIVSRQQRRYAERVAAKTARKVETVKFTHGSNRKSPSKDRPKRPMKNTPDSKINVIAIHYTEKSRTFATYKSPTRRAHTRVMPETLVNDVLRYRGQFGWYGH